MWSREEMIIAFHLYCRTGGRESGGGDPGIAAVSELIGRTIPSIKFRLANYASCDPEYKKDGKKGLTHGGKNVQEIWDEFSGDMERLSQETDEILRFGYRYVSSEFIIDSVDSFEAFPIGWEREQIVAARRNQSFFREAVLASYNNKCCITGIGDRDLLIASHIKPWKDSDARTERTNPRNGLCLNALHDRAFDKGLLTVTEGDHTVRLSKTLKKSVDRDAYEKFFGMYEDRRIAMPARFAPDEEMLRHHNTIVFESRTL
ncbi:MAG: HNH endonuclease [Candidatus Methanoplasma sp.]|nr:HNH endonuclease [Candidatus Methanoplasma sp.]